MSTGHVGETDTTDKTTLWSVDGLHPLLLSAAAHCRGVGTRMTYHKIQNAQNNHKTPIDYLAINQRRNFNV